MQQLQRFTRYPLPSNVSDDIVELMGRFGKIVLESAPEGLVLSSADASILHHLMLHLKMRPLIIRQLDPNRYLVSPENRGVIKQVLTSISFPLRQSRLCGWEPFEIVLRKEMLSGRV